MIPEDVPEELVDMGMKAHTLFPRVPRISMPPLPTHEEARRLLVREILAAVIPLIEAREREACAAMVDCGCLHKADVLAVRDENSGDRWRACGRDPCGALEARAIRARGT